MMNLPIILGNTMNPSDIMAAIQSGACLEMTENFDENNHQMRPYVRIIEEPSPKVRFRYKVEGPRATPVPGINSSSDNKSFPSIEIVGYNGAAVVIVSCVTKDPPYRAHPHEIVGRESCLQGVCKMNIPHGHSGIIKFPNLGIQCVKRKEVEDSLRLREQKKIDPFKQGFEHRNQSTSIDLSAVRLCFQVILKNGPEGEWGDALEPVVSLPIFDKKANNELNIVKMSDYECHVDGGKKDIILLCEKVLKDDIKIRFFEEREGLLVWEAFGDFHPSQVHKQSAIWFRPPKYGFINITEPVKVNVELFKPSDGSRSEPVPFDFLPLPVIENTSNQKSETSNHQTRKKPKLMDFNNLSMNLDGNESLQNFYYTLSTSQTVGLQTQHCQLNIPNSTIKVEPGDNSISPFGGQVFLGPPRESSPHEPTIPAVLQTFEQPSSSSWNIFPSQPEALPQPLQNHTAEYLGLSDVSFDSGLLEMANPQELKPIVLNSGELEEQQLSESFSNISL